MNVTNVTSRNCHRSQVLGIEDPSSYSLQNNVCKWFDFKMDQIWQVILQTPKNTVPILSMIDCESFVSIYKPNNNRNFT